MGNRAVKLALLALGLALAAYFSRSAPREQHVTLVLGNAAPDVSGLEIQYVAPGGEVAQDARLAYAPGSAPRVVSHSPKLADGEYVVHIDVDTREGRRQAERRVTLGGGTTQIDLGGVLSRTAP